MKEVTITLHCTVADSAVDELRQAVEHHIESLVDVEGWSSDIESFYDCSLEVEDE